MAYHIFIMTITVIWSCKKWVGMFRSPGQKSIAWSACKSPTILLMRQLRLSNNKPSIVASNTVTLAIHLGWFCRADKCVPLPGHRFVGQLFQEQVWPSNSSAGRKRLLCVSFGLGRPKPSRPGRISLGHREGYIGGLRGEINRKWEKKASAADPAYYMARPWAMGNAAHGLRGPLTRGGETDCIVYLVLGQGTAIWALAVTRPEKLNKEVQTSRSTHV